MIRIYTNKSLINNPDTNSQFHCLLKIKSIYDNFHKIWPLILMVEKTRNIVLASLTYLDSFNKYIVLYSYKALMKLREGDIISTEPYSLNCSYTGLCSVISWRTGTLSRGIEDSSNASSHAYKMPKGLCRGKSIH
jgi:hypothetical protein